MSLGIALMGIMTAILILSLAFFYLIAFYGLSPQRMALTGIGFLLVAGSLMAVALRLALPYRQQQ
jgi:hypothetical protein